MTEALEWDAYRSQTVRFHFTPPVRLEHLRPMLSQRRSPLGRGPLIPIRGSF